MKKKYDKNKGSDGRWLISFADLLSVVLVFMILIYSTGQNVNKTTNDYTLSEQSYFSIKKDNEQSRVRLDSSGSGFTAEYLQGVFYAKFQRDALLKNIPIEIKEDRKSVV